MQIVRQRAAPDVGRDLRVASCSSRRPDFEAAVTSSGHAAALVGDLDDGGRREAVDALDGVDALDVAGHLPR